MYHCKTRFRYSCQLIDSEIGYDKALISRPKRHIQRIGSISINTEITGATDHWEDCCTAASSASRRRTTRVEQIASKLVFFAATGCAMARAERACTSGGSRSPRISNRSAKCVRSSSNSIVKKYGSALAARKTWGTLPGVTRWANWLQK